MSCREKLWNFRDVVTTESVLWYRRKRINPAGWDKSRCTARSNRVVELRPSFALQGHFFENESSLSYTERSCACGWAPLYFRLDLIRIKERKNKSSQVTETKPYEERNRKKSSIPVSPISSFILKQQKRTRRNKKCSSRPAGLPILSCILLAASSFLFSNAVAKHLRTPRRLAPGRPSTFLCVFEFFRSSSTLRMKISMVDRLDSPQTWNDPIQSKKCFLSHSLSIFASRVTDELTAMDHSPKSQNSLRSWSTVTMDEAALHILGCIFSLHTL